MGFQSAKVASHATVNRAPAFNPARPATFDRAAQLRRSMIGKIQVARKDLAMEEDDYRQIVFDETGRLSLKEANPTELQRVIARMERLGFKPVPKAFGGSRPAQHPVAGKARALWISLFQLGVVHNPSEQAFEHFACKMLGCDKLVWAKQSDGFKLIEALKAMAKRGGWPQTGTSAKPLTLLALQDGLCLAILRRLGEAQVVPADWTLNKVLERRCGWELPAAAWTADTYQAAAASLGQLLRAEAPSGFLRPAQELGA